MSIFSNTDVFFKVQFAATRRWLGTTAGTYFSCVLQIFDAHSQHASFGKAFEPTGFPRVPLANATALTIV